MDACSCRGLLMFNDSSSLRLFDSPAASSGLWAALNQVKGSRGMRSRVQDSAVRGAPNLGYMSLPSHLPGNPHSPK